MKIFDIEERTFDIKVCVNNVKKYKKVQEV